MSEGVWARSRISKMRGEDGLAAAVVEEDLVADEDVAGTKGRGGDLFDEAVGAGKAAE
jgi:hypothetical protein